MEILSVCLCIRAACNPEYAVVQSSESEVDQQTDVPDKQWKELNSPSSVVSHSHTMKYSVWNVDRQKA